MQKLITVCSTQYQDILLAVIDSITSSNEIRAMKKHFGRIPIMDVEKKVSAPKGRIYYHVERFK